MPTEPDAVYFSPEDYAGPLRRVGAFLVDLLVVVFALAVFTQILVLLYVPRDVLTMPPSPMKRQQVSGHFRPARIPWGLGMLALPLSYHTALRRLRGGTLGYRLMGIRLVDQHGEPPPWQVLGRRFLFGVVGVIPLAATYLRCLNDPRRRAFHDQWSGTWVVRKRARPAGPAVTAYQTKMLGTFLLTCADIEPVVSTPPDPKEDEQAPEALCNLGR